MSGHTDLAYLLRAADPVLDEAHYVFVSVPGEYGDYANWDPIATFKEAEGLTLVIRRAIADEHGIGYDDILQRITLRVHSSLSAVGLTAAFSTALTQAGISANVMAGYYHDHIFVPVADAARAMIALDGLANADSG